LRAIKTQDRLIKDWLSEIEREIALQDKVLTADKSSLEEYRGGTWNIYLFGHLAEMLKPQFEASHTDVEMTCYTYGRGPDTIFNFGWAREPRYMEINYSGRLNLKMSLDTSESKESRWALVKQEIDKCRQMTFDRSPTYHPGGKIGGSKTIASFDVGLINTEGHLECRKSIEDTKKRIFAVVSKFYGNTPSAPGS